MTEKISKTLNESQQVTSQRLSETCTNCSSTPELMNESQFHTVGNSASPNESDIQDSLQMFTPTADVTDPGNVQVLEEDISTLSGSKRKSKKFEGKPREKPSKRRKSGCVGLNAGQFIPDPDVHHEQSERQLSTPDSVSLLRDCYEEDVLTLNNGFRESETCMNPYQEMFAINRVDWNGERYSANSVTALKEDDDNDSEKIFEDFVAKLSSEKVNRACQTDASIFSQKCLSRREGQIHYHGRFLQSLVRFKYMLASKVDISKEALCSVLNAKFKLNIPSNYEGSDIIPRDAVKYMLRSSNFDTVFQATVSSLLDNLKMALERDLDNMGAFWQNSVYELAVKTLAEAVSREPRLKSLFDNLFNSVISSILKEGSALQNFVQETRAAFLVVFCDIYDCYDVISHIIRQLKELNTAKRMGNSCLSDVYACSRLVRNSYFLIRTLHKLLESFSVKWESRQTESFSVDDSTGNNYSVLEMWKKNWRQAEIMVEEKRSGGDLQNPHQNSCNWDAWKWCNDLEEILVHSVIHFPILANIIERCCGLAKDIARKCQSQVKVS